MIGANGAGVTCPRMNRRRPGSLPDAFRKTSVGSAGAGLDTGTRADARVRVQVSIERVAAATPALVEAFRRLLPALSPSAPQPTLAQLQEIIGATCNALLVARLDDTIVGSVTLVFITIPSGRRARLESVVVDPSARQRGIGEALCRAAIRLAGDAGVTQIDLTSSPARAAANRLYARLGFQRRDTNVFRLPLSPG